MCCVSGASGLGKSSNRVLRHTSPWYTCDVCKSMRRVMAVMSTQYHNDNGTVPFHSRANLNYYSRTGDFPTLNVPVTYDFHTLLQNTNNNSVPQVAWATVPQELIDNPNDSYSGRFSDPTLGAILSVPAEDFHGAMVYPCTIDSRLAPASATSLVQAVVGDEPANNTYPRILIDDE